VLREEWRQGQRPQGAAGRGGTEALTGPVVHRPRTRGIHPLLGVQRGFHTQDLLAQCFPALCLLEPSVSKAARAREGSRSLDWGAGVCTGNCSGTAL